MEKQELPKQYQGGEFYVDRFVVEMFHDPQRGWFANHLHVGSTLNQAKKNVYSQFNSHRFCEVTFDVIVPNKIINAHFKHNADWKIPKYLM